MYFCIKSSIGIQGEKKGKRKVPPRHQEEEKTDKSKQTQIA